MTESALTPLRRSVGLSSLTLLVSLGTLLCCVLPVVMVTLGAGAALAGLVVAVPQLVWLSAHKAVVFGVAGGLVVLAGLLLRQAARMPCPVDPVAGRRCARLRRLSRGLWIGSCMVLATGALFAFVLPRLR